MSNADQLTLIKTQSLAVMAEITAFPKPTYEIDGQSFSWNAYLLRLQQTIAWCDKQLAAEVPFEVDTQAQT